MSSSPVLPLPRTLALVDDDAEYSEYLAQHLEALGVDVHHFADSNDLLTEEQPFGFGFYIVDLHQHHQHGQHSAPHVHLKPAT